MTRSLSVEPRTPRPGADSPGADEASAAAFGCPGKRTTSVASIKPWEAHDFSRANNGKGTTSVVPIKLIREPALAAGAAHPARHTLSF